MAMGPLLQDKVVIVTGGAQGIGREYVRSLIAEGANVVIGDIAPADDLVGEMNRDGHRCEFVRTDVTQQESVAQMVRRGAECFGKIDILVNNAGLFSNLKMSPFEEISSEEWDRVMAVNVRGTFECAKAVLPYMKERRSGKIINIASGTVFKGTPLLSHYVASKGAVIALTRSMAREVGQYGISVNTLSPGLIMTDNVAANPDWSDAVTGANVQSRALKREATPRELVGTLMFLCSDQSSFVTGQCIVADGGSVMH